MPVHFICLALTILRLALLPAQTGVCQLGTRNSSPLLSYTKLTQWWVQYGLQQLINLTREICWLYLNKAADVRIDCWMIYSHVLHVLRLQEDLGEGWGKGVFKTGRVQATERMGRRNSPIFHNQDRISCLLMFGAKAHLHSPLSGLEESMSLWIPLFSQWMHLGNKEIKVDVRDRGKPAGQGVKLGKRFSPISTFESQEEGTGLSRHAWWPRVKTITCYKAQERQSSAVTGALVLCNTQVL